MTEIKLIVFIGLFLGTVANCPCSAVGEDTVEIHLKQGAIHATRVDLTDGKYYYPFKSIPYAEPPVGRLRLKDPVPAGPWTGVRNGSAFTMPCPQLDLASTLSGEIKVAGEEDCLFLDVYTPKPYEGADLPVMVWIHGGGFVIGGNEGLVPSPIVAKGVIVVSIQYRLGALGFMSTDDAVMPGNVGLKDQVMALRWVQKNIRDFGGDPNSVTIFGESAGGISVHLHILSPMSKGLFHRAIAQSGTVMLPGIIRNDHRERAADVGEILECPGVDKAALDSQVLYDCLRDISLEKMVQLPSAFFKFWQAPQVMLPSVDGKFLPRNPVLMLKEGDYQGVDFMTGINKDEGCIMVRAMYLDPTSIDTLAQNFSMAGPTLLGFDNNAGLNEYMAKRTYYHYLGGFKITEETADAAVKMHGDHMFNIPLDVSAQLHARDEVYGNKLFLYELHHLSDSSFLNSPNFTSGHDWVCHADELQYLFDTPFIPRGNKAQDVFMSDIINTLWTNFAATGNPTPDMSLGFKWPHVKDSHLRYLILKPSPYMRDFNRQDELEFWTNLPIEQNKKLYPERFR